MPQHDLGNNQRFRLPCGLSDYAEVSFVKTDNGLGDVPTMNIKTSTKDKFANNYWVLMAVMIIVLAVTIEIAARPRNKSSVRAKYRGRNTEVIRRSWSEQALK